MQQPYLLVTDETGGRKQKIEGDKLTIGRHVQNGLPIQDQMASRFHAEVMLTALGWMLRDLDSRNGTQVNGRKTREAILQNGDVIEIGATRLRFMMPAGDAAPAPKPAAEKSESSPAAVPAAASWEIGDLGPEDQLANMAAALPVGFVANDIIILNARGQVSLPPVLGKRKEETAHDPLPLFRLLLLVCIASGASDIHVEPREEDALIRIRVDGGMLDACMLPKELSNRLCSMIKVLSDLDIAQKMTVQEGHFSARVPANVGQSAEKMELRRIDYRVSFAPSVFGQKLVIRIQDNQNSPTLIDQLHLPPWMLDELNFAIQQDSGMVLVSGPTGSGKTTTLYALLRSLDIGQRNVITIENPVEIQIPGITQLPVDEEQGKSFSALLRSVLRQDPDVILVGEIRDEETARTAMQASITGHLVFSTVHTKDTFGTIYRLLDLGVEPFLLAQGLSTIIAQRLVRHLCPECRREFAPTPDQQRKLTAAGTAAKTIFEPAGCERCLQTGFSGRRGIFELLSVTDPLREAIARNATMGEIAKIGADRKFTKLLYSGYQAVAQGVTSFDEVERTVGR